MTLPKIYDYLQRVRQLVSLQHPITEMSADELLLVASLLDSWSRDLKNEHERRKYE